ncbi:MAG: DUF6531 domain-containing protein, partial [Planctomycetaceae bacterium]
MLLSSWKQLFAARLRASRINRRRRVPQASSRIEQLEDRTLLSSASFADGVFAFTSDAGLVNNVTVSESGGLVTIRDTAASITPTGLVQQGADSNEVTFATSQVTRVQLDLGDGADTATAAGLAIPLLVDAGDGADSITGGEAGDTLNGSNDGDSLVGGGGNDKLNGSGGDDVLIGGAGDDTANGGGGEDTLDGGTGNDLVRGQGSEDTLTGGADDDTIDGGPAYDQVCETADADFTITDTSLTGDGNDVLVDIEETYLTGGSSPNTFDGTGFDGRFVVNAKGGNDTLLGGAHADRLLGGAGRDSIIGGDGDDVLRGQGGGFDTLVGGPGNDRLNGGIGSDLVQGGEGNDQLTGETGNDTLEGGTGTDKLVERDNADMTLSDTSLTGDLGTDVILSIERAFLKGGNGDNTLDASSFSGRVTMVGVGGDDLLVGGPGADSLVGRAGDDTLNGGPGTDTLKGLSGSDSLNGGADNDTLDGGSDNDTVVGEAGDDRLVGSLGDDNLDGGDGADTLLGKEGNDTLDGGNGDDNLDGALGDDSLTGGAGDDTLADGMGDDTVEGGGGDDEYQLTPGSTDLVTDTGGDDRLNFSGASAGITLDIDATTLQAATVTGNLQLTGVFEDVTGSGFDDSFSADSLGSGRTIDGGAGADTLTADNVANSWNITGSDAGTVAGDVAFSGFESLQGGSDTDTFVFDDGVTFGGTVDGGSGTNALDYSAWTTGVTANLTTSQTGNTDGVSNISNVNGGSGNDQLTGDASVNLLTGGAGHDMLIGGDGNDVLVGGDDDDTLRGGLGDDSLEGAAGDDLLEGFDGNDTLADGSGDDTLEGGGDDDEYMLTPGSTDLVNDTAGEDRLNFSNATAGITIDIDSMAVQAVTGTGNLVLIGDLEHFTGSGFDDVVSVDVTADSRSILGGAGSNKLHSDDQANTWTITATDSGDIGGSDRVTFSGFGELEGGAGDETFALADGTGVSGVLDGAGGNDTISYAAYSAANAVTVDLGLGTATETGGATNFENVTGGSGGDQLTGDAGANVLAGGVGDDVLSGADGNDLLSGGDDNDTLDGGAGEDSLDGALGNDSLTGGIGNDTLADGMGNDSLDGGVGDDTYVLTPGSDDVVQDGEGYDLVDFSKAGNSINVQQRAVTSGGNTVVLQGDFEAYFLTDFADTLNVTELDFSVTAFLAGGDDIANLTSHPDNIFTGSGNDTTDCSGGADGIDIGSGTDSDINCENFAALDGPLLRPGLVVGQVISEGQGVEGADVELRSNGRVIDSTISGPEGYFGVINPRPEGRHEFAVRSAGHTLCPGGDCSGDEPTEVVPEFNFVSDAVSSPWNMVAGDLNGDNHADLGVIIGMQGVDIFLTDNLGNYTVPTSTPFDSPIDAWFGKQGSGSLGDSIVGGLEEPGTNVFARVVGPGGNEAIEVMPVTHSGVFGPKSVIHDLGPFSVQSGITVPAGLIGNSGQDDFLLLSVINTEDDTTRFLALSSIGDVLVDLTSPNLMDKMLLADIDGEGVPELVASSADGWLYALGFDVNGVGPELLWPKNIQNTSFEFGKDLASGDFDGDGVVDFALLVADVAPSHPSFIVTALGRDYDPVSGWVFGDPVSADEFGFFPAPARIECGNFSGIGPIDCRVWAADEFYDYSNDGAGNFALAGIAALPSGAPITASIPIPPISSSSCGPVDAAKWDCQEWCKCFDTSHEKTDVAIAGTDGIWTHGPTVPVNMTEINWGETSFVDLILKPDDLANSFVVENTSQISPVQNPAGRTPCEPCQTHVDAGDTVFLHSGELYLDRVDLEIPGRGFDWRFHRKYRSGIAFEGPLGHGWEHNYNRRLVVADSNNLAVVQLAFPRAKVDDVARMDGHGRSDLYQSNGDDSYGVPTGFYTELVKETDGSFTERDSSGNVVTFAAPDADGVAPMSSLADRNGNTMSFQYDGNGHLVRVLDTLGRPIDYSYTGDRLTQVTDFLGRT